MTDRSDDTPTVVAENLGRAYGKVHALQGFHLRIQRGEILTLLGPSGCGKSTTLRLIAGLDRPTSGRVEIDGQLVADAHSGVFVPPERRNVGMVFQDFALFPHMTVAQNVAFGLQAIRERPARRAAVGDLLALVGLGGLGGRLPHELSGGQQQRVALARALAPRPALLMLDEPFSNLDARMRHSVRDEVRDIIEETRTTAIFVTHDQEEALFMGDRVAILNGGRLEQVGRPEQVFRHPATHFVADFIGQARFIAGRVVSTGLGSGRVHTALGTLPEAYGADEGADVLVLVRPDEVRIEPAEDGVGQVHRRVFQGLHYMYRIALANGEQLKVQAPHTLRLDEGARVHVTLQSDRPLTCFVEGRAMTPLEGARP